MRKRSVSQQQMQVMAQTRRQAVASLAQAGKTLAEIQTALPAQGVRNPRTGKAYSRQTLKADLTVARPAKTPAVEILRNGMRHFRRPFDPVAETIGQWTYTKPYWQARILLNVDLTWKDYVFWDALRRGTAPGYTVTGPAFCLPSAQTIASYVFGKGMTASILPPGETGRAVHEAALGEANGRPTQNKKNALGQPTRGKTPLSLLPKAKPDPGATDALAYTNAQLRRFLERNQGFLVGTAVDTFCLGNQYLIVNPDCTLSIASPETVTVEYSASDYRRPLRYIIRTKNQQARVEDVYTAAERIITVHYYDKREVQIYKYENLIGRIPIVHWVNDRSANEIYGRPIYEAGLPIMRMYEDLLNNILNGVTLLGTPIPVFQGMDNLTETKLANSDAYTYEDEEGNEQTGYELRFDRSTGIFIGKGGEAKMLSTNVGFTKDSLDSLRQLFLLWLNETHIPELIWGGAIASSKASAETQMPPFIQYINLRRLMLEGEGADPALGIEARGGLLELIDIWLRTYKLLNPSIIVGPVQIEWPEIDFMADQTKYLWGTYLSGTGKISDESTVKLSGYFPDPAEEVRKAAGQRRPGRFDDYDARLRAARLKALRAQNEPPDDSGAPLTTDWVTPESDILLGQQKGNDQVEEHLHAEGEALKGDPMNPFGPLPWLNWLKGGPG